jgi:uncharacterized membrane protein YqiK
VGKEAVACYRLYAANCVELAERTSDADRRVFLLRMGQRWAKLADQVEKAERADSDAASCHLPAASCATEIQASQANVSQAQANGIPGDRIRIDQTGVDQSRLNQTGDQTNGDAGVSSC